MSERKYREDGSTTEAAVSVTRHILADVRERGTRTMPTSKERGDNEETEEGIAPPPPRMTATADAQRDGAVHERSNGTTAAERGGWIV